MPGMTCVVMSVTCVVTCNDAGGGLFVTANLLGRFTVLAVFFNVVDCFSASFWVTRGGLKFILNELQ